MNFVNYVNNLKKIELNDIKEIINQSLNQNEEVAFGFRNQRGRIFFGELVNGFVVNPSIVVSDNLDNICQELYDLLQSEYSIISSYSYEHAFSGEYDYYVNLGNVVQIYFPNLSEVHQKWIVNQIYNVDKKMTL